MAQIDQGKSANSSVFLDVLPPELIAKVSQNETDLTPELRLDRNGKGATNLAAVDANYFENLFEEIADEYKGGDTKMVVAMLVGRMSFALLRPLAGLALEFHWLTIADTRSLAFVPRSVPWSFQCTRGSSLVFDLAVVPKNLGFQSGSAAEYSADFQNTIEALCTPLVEAAVVACGLSRGALWRLIGDELSMAFLAQGKLLGCVDKAITTAETMLRRNGAKLFSKQTQFINVEVPERPEITQWFRKRGGCCRFYTCEDGGYCTTCVLRDDASRVQRLTDYLRQISAA